MAHYFCEICNYDFDTERESLEHELLPIKEPKYEGVILKDSENFPVIFSLDKENISFNHERGYFMYGTPNKLKKLNSFNHFIFYQKISQEEIDERIKIKNFFVLSEEEFTKISQLDNKEFLEKRNINKIKTLEKSLQ